MQMAAPARSQLVESRLAPRACYFTVLERTCRPFSKGFSRDSREGLHLGVGDEFSRAVERRSARLLPESRVERPSGGREVQTADELLRVRRSVLAVHAGVFPLDRQRPVVAYFVECADDLFKVDSAVAG